MNSTGDLLAARVRKVDANVKRLTRHTTRISPTFEWLVIIFAFTSGKLGAAKDGEQSSVTTLALSSGRALTCPPSIARSAHAQPRRGLVVSPVVLRASSYEAPRGLERR